MNDRECSDQHVTCNNNNNDNDNNDNNNDNDNDNKLDDETMDKNNGKTMKLTKTCKKGVRFENVKIYLFERTQGFDGVPSSGGFALGMGTKHFDIREVALTDTTNDDNTAELRDCKTFTENLVKQAYATTTERKRKHYEAFDENVAATKRQKSNVGCEEPATSEGCEEPATSEGCGESLTSERASCENEPAGGLGYVDGQDEENRSNECNDAVVVRQYFRPLSRRSRFLKLKNAGLKNFVKEDKAICDIIRESRKHCGCSCGTKQCLPETCECSRNEIECLVDRPSFPCACTAESCKNPFGHREFDETLVHEHFCSTLMRLQATESQNLDDFSSAMHLCPDDDG